MEDKFCEILEGVPEAWHRSSLAPYGDLIDELRRRGLPYREIAHILAEKCQLRVAWTTIIRFVHLRSKAQKPASVRKAAKHDGATLVNSNANVILVRKFQAPPPGPSDDEVQRRIAALKALPPEPAKNEDVFQYDPDEPLHLPQKPVTKRDSG
jgi:hypothetical protein